MSISSTIPHSLNRIPLNWSTSTCKSSSNSSEDTLVSIPKHLIIPSMVFTNLLRWNIWNPVLHKQQVGLTLLSHTDMLTFRNNKLVQVPVSLNSNQLLSCTTLEVFLVLNFPLKISGSGTFFACCTYSFHCIPCRCTNFCRSLHCNMFTCVASCTFFCNM